MTDITNNQNKIEFTKEFEQLINYTVKASFQYENIPEISVAMTKKFTNLTGSTEILTDLQMFCLFQCMTMRVI